MLVSLVVFNGRQRLVRQLLAVLSVGQLDIVRFATPDDGLLLLRGEPPPGVHVVHVPLHDDVAAARRGRVVGRGGKDGVGDIWRHGIRRAIDKAQQISRVEISKADCGILDGDGAAEQLHELALQLKVNVSTLCADVEQDIARRRHGRVLGAAHLAE